MPDANGYDGRCRNCHQPFTFSNAQAVGTDDWNHYCSKLCEQRSAYTNRQDGEGFSVPSGEVYRIACCDCGLVHDFVFVSDDGGPIGIAAKRNPGETAARRAAQKTAPH